MRNQGHVADHCSTPEITRHWKRLGIGALWLCTCSRMFVLSKTQGTYASDPEWVWVDRGRP